MAHTSFQLDRRQFLKAGLGAAGALAFSPGYLARALAAGKTTPGPGPYGPLQDFNANGIALPPGFSSREIARGANLVPGTLYPWHNATDGQATFPTIGPNGAPDGGWILVANSEVPLPLLGGVSGVEFAPDGRIKRAYRVLAGTTANCAGGPTPWGTWLSCEEHGDGMVHECDPAKLNLLVSRPALGVFQHEAVCVDPVHRRLYLTEDKGDGCLYRFTPASYPSIAAGLLEVAVLDGDRVSWSAVPNPGGGSSSPTRYQVPAAAHFNGGEGTWYDDGVVYFTTKGDERVWAYHVDASRLEVLYDAPALGPEAPLSGVDNITVAPSGDIYVCEDGRDHDICLITPGFEVSRFLKLHPQIHAGPPEGTPFEDNETVGVVFSPDGSRMYFGAQRSFGVLGIPPLPAGVVYEVTGPVRRHAGQAGQAPGRASPPGLRVRAQRRKHIKKFLRAGLPIELELDRASGVVATLRAKPARGRGKGKAKGKRNRGVTIARARSPVALRGEAALLLEPTRKAPKLLRRRRRVTATLRVTATDGNRRQTIARREVILDRGRSKRKRR